MAGTVNACRPDNFPRSLRCHTSKTNGQLARPSLRMLSTPAADFVQCVLINRDDIWFQQDPDVNSRAQRPVAGGVRRDRGRRYDPRHDHPTRSLLRPRLPAAPRLDARGRRTTPAQRIPVNVADAADTKPSSTSPRADAASRTFSVLRF